MANSCINCKSPQVLEVARELGVSTPVAAAMIQTVIDRKEKAGVTTPASSVSSPINIYAGTNENSHLSNFANRRFVDEEVSQSFDSVEQYFQPSFF